MEARNHTGETCLHVVCSDYFTRSECRSEWPSSPSKEAGLQRHLSESRDILISMISAGADVCAIDDQGRSVSDAAFNSGQEVAWTKALKYCGIDINDVLAHPNSDPARSTALNPRYNKRPKSVTSKLSLVEYLKRRKPCARVRPWLLSSPEISSSEDDDSEDEDYDDDDERENKNSAEDTNESSSGREEEFVPENGRSGFTYQGREKAKLD